MGGVTTKGCSRPGQPPPPRLSRSGAHRVLCPVAYVPTARLHRTVCLPVALMPVANVPTTRLLGGVEVRVDAQSSACASRRGGRTRRTDAGSAPGLYGDLASNSPRALVAGCSPFGESWDRLFPATTVDGSSARGSPIRLMSGRIGGFPFASLPLEGFKRRDPHLGRCARRSESAVMPISSSWRIDSDRRRGQLPSFDLRGTTALRTRRRRSGHDRSPLAPPRRALVAGRHHPAC